MPQFSFFGGALVFSVRPTTPGARMRRQRLLDHPDRPALTDGLDEIAYRNMCHMLAVTADIAVDVSSLNTTGVEAADKAEVWQQRAAALRVELARLDDLWTAACRGEKPSVLYETFIDLHAALYDVWVEAVNRADIPLPQVPVAQRPAEQLTPEERADPK